MKNLKMDLNIKELTKMEKRMDMESINGEMDASMKETLNKIIFMGREYTIGIHKNMMDHGFILLCMDMVHLNLGMENANILDNFTMA